MDPNDSDVTAKDTTNGDGHDYVTVRYDAEDYEDTKPDGGDGADKQGVIGSEIRKIVMCHMVQEMLEAHGNGKMKGILKSA